MGWSGVGWSGVGWASDRAPSASLEKLTMHNEIVRVVVKNTVGSDRHPGAPDSDAGTADHAPSEEKLAQ